MNARKLPRKPTLVHWQDFEDDSLVTDVQAAQLLSVSVFSLRAWRVARPVERGPKFSRLGTAVRYRLRDLRAFVERNVVETADDPDPTLRRAG